MEELLIEYPIAENCCHPLCLVYNKTKRSSGWYTHSSVSLLNYAYFIHTIALLHLSTSIPNRFIPFSYRARYQHPLLQFRKQLHGNVNTGFFMNKNVVINWSYKFSLQPGNSVDNKYSLQSRNVFRAPVCPSRQLNDITNPLRAYIGLPVHFATS